MLARLERRLARQLALFDAIEREGGARSGDVVFHERRFALLLVRRDGESLQRRGVALAGEHRDRVNAGGRDQETRIGRSSRPLTARPAATTAAAVSASAAGIRACASA